MEYLECGVAWQNSAEGFMTGHPTTVSTARLAEVPLSDKTLGTVVKAWKVGGVGLTLLVIGAMTILSAFFIALSGRSNWLAIVFLIVGSAPIVFVGVSAYLQVIRPVAGAKKKIEENAAVLDAVQETTLVMAAIVRKFSDYALFHANDIVSDFDAVKAVLSVLPLKLGDKVLKLDYFEKGDDFARAIRAIAERTDTVVDDVREAISKADASRIIQHVRDLKELAHLIEVQLFKKS
jgi:hypothetical protein